VHVQGRAIESGIHSIASAGGCHDWWYGEWEGREEGGARKLKHVWRCIDTGQLPSNTSSFKQFCTSLENLLLQK